MYEGQFLYNKKNGKGKEVWIMKGESYDGMWSDDMFDGYGKHSTLNFIYEGYFKQGKRQG